MEAILNRRGFLRGVGACVALPALPSLLPRWASADGVAETSASAAAEDPPLRMAFITIPNGVNLEQWWPKGEGKNFHTGGREVSLRVFALSLCPRRGLHPSGRAVKVLGNYVKSRAMSRFSGRGPGRAFRPR